MSYIVSAVEVDGDIIGRCRVALLVPIDRDSMYS